MMKSARLLFILFVVGLAAVARFRMLARYKRRGSDE
jgi:hypothetical protein